MSADDPDRDNVRAHSPGVCFLPGAEWDRPALHEGRVARMGERLPRVGGPNFLVNEPPTRDIEVRLTYRAEEPGAVRVYDGESYREVAALEVTGEWATANGRVPREVILSADADRQNYPGMNLMFDVDCARVWVHRIEVRAAPRG